MILNSLRCCKGVFTRIKNTNADEKSVLDYVCTTNDLSKLVKDITIDEEKINTPWRSLRNGKKYSDHSAILVKMSFPKSDYRSEKPSKTTVWNFNDQQGWEKFQQITQHDLALANCWQGNVSVEEGYQKWQKRLNGLMHKCFKKKKITASKMCYNKKIRGLMNERKLLKKSFTKKGEHRVGLIRKIDKKIDHEIARFNSKTVKNRIRQGVSTKQDFWKLKKILAPKNTSIPHSLVDRLGNEITDPDNIRDQFQMEFQHRLRQRKPKDHVKCHVDMQNELCKMRLRSCNEIESPDFTLIELDTVIRSFKNGKSRDNIGLIREIFKKGGESLRLSILCMMNTIKKNKAFPLDWNTILVQTILKKKTGSMRDLDNYRGIFIVPILSLLFEKLLKNRITPCLEKHMTQFQTGGVKGKGVVDNLFTLRAIIDHCKYIGKEVWLTFYDIEKCFDSLWLEDCIVSLFDNGVKNDLLNLVYKMNQSAEIVVRTPFGDTDSFQVANLVKQGTVMGPVLNNCSLDQVCKEGNSYQYGTVEIKTLEFVDDMADANDDLFQAKRSNDIIVSIQEQKKLTFAVEKCKILKVGPIKDRDASIYINDKKVDIVDEFRYLGDEFTSKGDNSVLCKTRQKKATGNIIEIMSLCKEVNFGKRQISSMMLLYHSVFVPRLIYNSEVWSNLTKKDLSCLENAQLQYLRYALEVPKSTPVAAMFLELGILPVQFEIEKRQLLFLKRILDKEKGDPVYQVYDNMTKYQYENNWAKCVVTLRERYDLPLNDQNIKNMSKFQWKKFVNERIRSFAFDFLLIRCQMNSKTKHLKYEKFVQASYLTCLSPQIARMIFRARLKMYDIKVNFKRMYKENTLCPFCRYSEETFEHIFHCPEGLSCPLGIRFTHQDDITDNPGDLVLMLKVGKYLLKYKKYRELII